MSTRDTMRYFEITVDGDIKIVDKKNVKSFKQDHYKDIGIYYSFRIYFNSDGELNTVASSLVGFNIKGVVVVAKESHSADIKQFVKFIEHVSNYGRKLKIYDRNLHIDMKKTQICDMLRKYIPYIVDRNDKKEYYLINKNMEYIGLDTKSKPVLHGKSTQIRLYDSIKGLYKSKGLFKDYVERYFNNISDYDGWKLMIPVRHLTIFHNIVVGNIGKFYQILKKGEDCVEST